MASSMIRAKDACFLDEAGDDAGEQPEDDDIHDVHGDATPHCNADTATPADPDVTSRGVSAQQQGITLNARKRIIKQHRTDTARRRAASRRLVDRLACAVFVRADQWKLTDTHRANIPSWARHVHHSHDAFAIGGFVACTHWTGV